MANYVCKYVLRIVYTSKAKCHKWFFGLPSVCHTFSKLLDLPFLFFRQKSFVVIVISHYNPSVRIIDFVSHTTYVVCVNFIHEWQVPYSLQSIPNDRFFLRNFSWQFYLLSECQKSAERKQPKKYFSYFVLMS